MSVKTEWQTVQVADGTEMRIYIAIPESAPMGETPGILVLQEAFGVNHHIRALTAQIAALGYVAVAPELFHRTAPPGFEGDYSNFPAVMPHMQALTEATLSADVTAAYDWLKVQSAVDGRKIAATGYCMGGRTAFLANAVLPLACAVSYYGGRIAPDLLPRAKDQHGPILFFWGGSDDHIPVADRLAVHAAMDAVKKPYIDVVFSDAKHAFSNDDRKDSFHPAATKQAWALFTTFLADNFARVV